MSNLQSLKYCIDKGTYSIAVRLPYSYLVVVSDWLIKLALGGLGVGGVLRLLALCSG